VDGGHPDGLAATAVMAAGPSTGGVGSGVTDVAFTGTSARVSKKENHAEAVSIGQSKASALVNK